MNIIGIFGKTLIITTIWFIAGGILYMNPIVANIYKQFENHPSMKIWETQKKYLLATYVVAGFLPILVITFAYNLIKPTDFLILGVLLVAIRVIPRLCDNWVQTSYPNKILLIELLNGTFLNFLIALLITTFY